jgi:hypothetical protein
VAPRWLEVGISGVPRQREWDLVSIVDVPELEGASVSQLAFKLLADGSSAGPDLAHVPPEALARLAAVVAEGLDPPCDVRAVRRGVRDWSVAARELDLELAELPALAGIDELAVAVAPDGNRTVLVDGEEAGASAGVEQAVLELERRGRERFPAFVARAVRGSAGWELTIDPL